MNANEFTFGIEIETTVSRETITREHLNIAPYHSGGSQVPYLPQGWVAKQDSSIRAENGSIGCEIVSPVLKGEDGIRQVFEVGEDAQRETVSGEREYRNSRSHRL